MGRGFEILGSQQQPAGTIAQVNRFDVFLPAERCSVHHQDDHLMSERDRHLRHIRSRLDQPQSHRMAHVMKLGV